MKNIFLVIFSFVIVATTLSFHTTKAQAASWLEQELDGNEPYIQATERTLSKNRDDITLADLEAITSLSIYQSSDIPDKISDYKNLKFLVSQRLASTEIPNSIGQLKKLETLRLEYNNLQKFPRVVFQLPSLRILNLTHGNITEIPTEITGLSSHLRQLDIKENKLVTIPTSIFTTDWKAGFEHKLILGTARNQITSDIPAGYLYGIDYGGNMLEFYNLSPIKQDQLIYTGNSIVVPLNTNFNQLKPDKIQLGLQSGKALFANHTFIYHDDGTSNNVLTNGVATHRGNGYITIKSSNSTNSNPFAKVRVPITVTDPIAGQDVTVRYVDGVGNELAPTDILSGNVGDTYTSTAKDIEGWKLKTAPSNATGTFSDTAQTVTYVYEKQVVAGQDVIVRYVDGAGNELAPTDTLSGNVGDTYTSTAKDIEGWLLETAPSNATGTFSDTAQTVTYVYEKEVVAGQDVTVRYVDGAGNELASTDILSGNVGDTYTSTAKDIEGWLLETAPENATGTFNDTAQTVAYVYGKNTDDIIPLPLPEEPMALSDDKLTDGKSNVTPTGKMSIQPTAPKELTKQTKVKSSLPKRGIACKIVGG